MTALMFMGVQRETFRCRVYGDDENLGGLDPCVALRADLARWLLAWLDGVECGACAGTGRDYTGRDGNFVDCPDCWGTGKLGRARAMEAALSERTPAPERMAE